MIEATIKDFRNKKHRGCASLVGARVSLNDAREPDSKGFRCINIGCVIKPRKGSRIPKEGYRTGHICGVVLENIVDEDLGYEED